MMELLKHFKELSLHPANAKELKGLILQLAVQGKLTAQWHKSRTLSGDLTLSGVEGAEVYESAQTLLQKIKAEKAQLIKEKKPSTPLMARIKKEETFPPITKEEIPFDLPDYWVWCRLGHSGYTQTGATPPKNNPNNYGDYIPFIGPADISNQSMKYPKDGLSELGISKGRLIPKDSLMMVCIGRSIGKCNVNEIDVSCNQQINIVTPILMPVSYIKIICQSPFFQKTIQAKASGSATPIINKGKWEMLYISLPPLSEQKVIVSKVEQLFAEVDQLEQLTVQRIKLKEQFATSALQRLADGNTQKEWEFLQQHFHDFFNETPNIKKLGETILQLAVQGKLTTHWRNQNRTLSGAEVSESAQTLLQKIKAEKAQLIKDKKIKKEVPLPPITKEEIPYELPEGWFGVSFKRFMIFVMEHMIHPNLLKAKIHIH